VSPASLTFVVDKGVVAEKVVTVLGPPTMDVTPTTTDNASVKVTLTPQTRDEAKAKTEPEAGKSWKLQVALGDEAPVGEWKATVTLKTTHSERSTITIPVDISIRGDLELSPKSAFFGFLKVGDKATRTIRLTSRSATALHRAGKEAWVMTSIPDKAIHLTNLTHPTHLASCPSARSRFC